MCLPFKVVLKKDPQVADRGCSSHREDLATWEAQCERGELCADKMREGVGGLETDVFSFVHINAKTIVGQPLHHGMKGCGCAICGDFMCQARHEDSSVVDICHEAMELPRFSKSEERGEVYGRQDG